MNRVYFDNVKDAIDYKNLYDGDKVLIVPYNLPFDTYTTKTMIDMLNVDSDILRREFQAEVDRYYTYYY